MAKPPENEPFTFMVIGEYPPPRGQNVRHSSTLLLFIQLVVDAMTDTSEVIIDSDGLLTNTLLYKALLLNLS